MTVSGVAEPIISRADCLEGLVQRRLGNRVRNFRLVVRDDGVILQGRASRYHAKQLAQHAAMELAQMPWLTNCITHQRKHHRTRTFPEAYRIFWEKHA